MRLSLSRVLVTLFVFFFSFRWSAAEGTRADEYQVWLDANQKISRSGSLGESLTWVIVQNGEIVLERNAANELDYTYFNNLTGKEYLAYLHKWGGTHYVRVSNIVGYRFGLVSDAPIVTSQHSAVALINTPFRYVITATGNASQFTAANLPPGLTLNDQGVISGTPTQLGHHVVAISASSGQNVGTASLALSVVSGVNDGGLTNRYTLVPDSTYAVTWNPNPSETNLTMVVKRDGAVVLGRNVLGKSRDGYFNNLPGYVYSIHFETVVGVSYQRVSNIVYYQPGAPANFPLITSPLSAAGTLGVSFTPYQIVAQNSPTTFAATGLPSGLSISATGLISGTPGESGTFPVVLSASNATGTATKPLTLTINATSSLGSLFTLTVDAQGVVRRSAGQLSGLCWVVRDNGVEVLRRVAGNEEAFLYFRSGVSNTYTVHLEAWLNGAYRTVSNKVGKPSATLAFLGESRLLLRAGQAMTPYTIELNAAYQTLNVGTLPAGLVRDGALITGTPTTPGIYTVALGAVAGAGTALRTLTIEVVPAVSTGQPQDAFSLRIDGNHTVTRSEGQLEGLAWVVVKDGETVLKRQAKGEAVFTYHRNFMPGSFAVYLEASIQGRPARVSNIVGYTTPSNDGAPVFVSPRRILLPAGRAVNLQLLASDAPGSFQAAGLPSGLSLSSAGLLSGTPSSAGVYPVTFSATKSGLTGTDNFMLEITAVSGGGGYADRHRLSIDANHTVSRTPGADPNLTWVIRRDGVEQLSRLAHDELAYGYHRNFEAGAYTVHLEAFLDGAYRVVSNTVGYTVAGAPGRALLTHALGSVTGSTTTFLEPKVGATKTDSGAAALGLTYTVNLTDGAVTITLEESTNLKDWTPITPTRRILGGDETFELREDVIPITGGAPRFHRVRVERAPSAN